ncbi:hypothetical protein KPH14_007766 [Odynerus spinipes]|uniref:Uncharacterized protein n=1 Tax=Odynerus spinipes TaxID=1348599 RepID=A0AAD9RJB1_9HYME|nr:hypothetical protein KPH14_007766 [Odynerus spinipes]
MQRSLQLFCETKVVCRWQYRSTTLISVVIISLTMPPFLFEMLLLPEKSNSSLMSKDDVNLTDTLKEKER